ncbi:hypothetical protein OQA88_12796 [Cercophora sp. LCS_1]
MGLLSFLSRKSGDKNKPKPKPADAAATNPLVKAPAKKPPVKPRRISPPVTNNNSTTAVGNVLGGQPAFSETQLSLDGAPVLESPPAAPSPTVPTFGEESFERPSTAPNGDQPTTVWANAGARLRKNPLRGAPPVSFRMLRPSTANPGSRPVSQSGPIPASLATSEASQPAQSFHVHSRSNSFSNSMRSDGGRGHKDLLDAQSEIKPTDFRSRVQASGGRDYGEDVADRNLGENGFNLDLPHVQEFYSRSAQGSVSEEASARPRLELSLASIRTKSLNSSTHFSLPKKSAAQVPLVPRVRPSELITDSQSPLLRRRQSVNTYILSGSLGSESDFASQRSVGHRTSSHPTRFVTTPDGERMAWDLPVLSTLALNSPRAHDRPMTARPATSHPGRIPRDSVVLAKQKTQMAELLVDDGIAISPLSTEPPSSLRSPPRSHHPRSHFTIHDPIREVAEPTLPPIPDSPEQTVRTRSVRGWSTSSATPTTSDTSSNPFQRPHSRHTANTSVDLSLGPPSLTKIPSHTSFDSGAVVSPQTAKSSNFNIDDYISSDDDSFVEARRPRGEGEEELLFSDSGYGVDGFQLPGLMDSLPTAGSPKAKQLLQHARSSISLPPIYDYDSFGRAGARRFILDTAADSDEEEYQSARDSPLRGLRGTKRLSAICGSPLKPQREFSVGSPLKQQTGFESDVVTEEARSKVDVSAAVRLRKENKAQKRASGVSTVRPRKARSALPLGMGLVDDEANHADVE